MKSTAAYLNELMPTLSPVEQRVAEYFIEHLDTLTGTPILDVANACSASKSAVVRLCKSIGYNGYKDFLTALSAEIALKRKNDLEYQDLFPDSPVASICVVVTQANIHALDNTMRMLDADAVERAANLLMSANRIDFYGVGGSGLVAQDAEMKFRRIGLNAYSSLDTHQQVVSAATLKEGDVAMFFSYSGQTKDLLDAHRLARQLGAKTISVTRYGKNELSSVADIALQVSSSEPLIRAGAMSSRLTMLQMVDMLFTVVSSRNYDQVRETLERTAQAVREKRV